MNSRKLPLLILVVAMTLGAAVVAGQTEPSPSISGRLTMIDGREAKGIRVAALVADGLSPVNTEPILVGVTQTDTTGQYRLDNMPPGRYFIMAGLKDSPSFYPGTQSISGARVVTVSRAATTTGIDFSVTPAGTARVKGTVRGLPSTLPKAIATVYMDSSCAKRREWSL